MQRIGGRRSGDEGRGRERAIGEAGKDAVFKLDQVALDNREVEDGVDIAGPERRVEDEPVGAKPADERIVAEPAIALVLVLVARLPV